MNTTTKALMDRLTTEGVEHVFGNTGGNCMAILINLPDGGELLVTDPEGPLTDHDLNVDDADRTGWFVGRYDSDGEPMDSVYEGDLIDVEAVVTAIKAVF